MDLSFTIAAGPSQRSHSQVRVSRNSWSHFTVSDSRLPQPVGPVPVFVFPRNRVARLYPQALGFLFVASYDSHGYGGCIRPHGISHPMDNPCQIHTATWSPETRPIRREITRKYSIKIVIEHAHAWNYDRKGGRNLCYKPSQQNQVHEYKCKEMGENIVKKCSIYR
jgi:hypothetical protein